MITVTRKIEFDAGHRVYKHEGKCANLHGHRYVAEIEATAPELDAMGRVIDFSKLKETIGAWIDKNWDHTTLLYENDLTAIQGVYPLQQNKPVFICSFNPTAENMAKYLLHDICPMELLGYEIKVVKVTIWETPNCKASASLEDVSN